MTKNIEESKEIAKGRLDLFFKGFNYQVNRIIKHRTKKCCVRVISDFEEIKINGIPSCDKNSEFISNRATLIDFFA
ncbi:hypothetical protein HZS_907 [Henneguya salminicola]|nr:hypothetical protein HZS_907 [Henneguya salminicola]